MYHNTLTMAPRLRQIQCMLRPGFFYSINCVNSDAESIHALLDSSREVSYKTFCKHCKDLDEWAQNMKYDIYRGRGGLRLKNDWAVSYHKGKYQGKPCYFLRHSGIEYIWLEGGAIIQ
jgi:hypothetical protein